MQIDIPEIPQYINVSFAENEDGERVGIVRIGEAIVYKHVLEDQDKGRPWYFRNDEDMEAVTAFGKMLALKIGD